MLTILFFFKFSFILSGVVSLFLGAFIYLQNKKQTTNKTYAGMSLCITVWSLGFFAMLSSKTVEAAFFWRWFMESGSVWIPALWLHFVYAFLNLDKGKVKRIIAVYTMSIFLWLLNLTDLFSLKLFTQEMVKRDVFDFYPKAGIGYYLFLFY